MHKWKMCLPYWPDFLQWSVPGEFTCWWLGSFYAYDRHMMLAEPCTDGAFHYC